MPITTICPPAPAVLIRITDPGLQAYLQDYPFASGPEPVMNERGLAAIAKAFVVRTSDRAAELALVSASDTPLRPEERARLETMASKLGIGRSLLAQAVNEYAWKVHPIPRDASRVVSVGCGDGMELLFLRAVLPQANITALDWKNKLLPGLAEVAGITHRVGNFIQMMSEPGLRYDLVFSNHVIEHMYDPDSVLRTLRNALAPGGVLLSALPMDGHPDGPLMGDILAIAQGRVPLHAIDMNMVDAGHPWKTNPSDLEMTLLGSGFEECRFFQRADHVSRTFAGKRAAFDRARRVNEFMFRVFCEVPNRVGKILLKRRVPARLVKATFSVQARMSFGANRLRNGFSEEVVLVARRGLT